jgi:hypothetical protein
MTLSEFKAWFEGFTEGMGAAPTADQFAKIKAKVEKIDGAPITQRIFVDRWWPTYPIWPDYNTASPALPPKVWYSNSAGNLASQAIGSSEGTVFAGYGDGLHRGPMIGEHAFDSHAAMRDLGRAEAMN